MSKLFKAAIGIGIITVISKVLGFAGSMILAYKFGTSSITDAYVLALSFPTVVFSFLLSGITSAYIPIYSRIKDGQERIKFNGHIMTFNIFISTILMVIFLLLSKQIVYIFAPGFDDKTAELAVKLFNIMILILPAKGMFNVIAGYYHSLERFNVVGVCNFLIVNLITILAILLSSYSNPLPLASVYVGGYILMTAGINILSKRDGLHYQLSLNFKDSNLLELFKLAIPMGLSLFANQINTVIDRMLASSLAEGTMTALNYANNIINMILGFTITILATIIYPRLNKLFANNDIKEAKYYVNRGMMITTLLCIPASFALATLSNPIVSLLYQRGTFDSKNTLITSQCLAFYSIGLTFYGYREILTRALASCKKQNTIFFNTILAIISNIILNVILVRYFGHIGLALATSISGGVSFILLYRSYYRVVGKDYTNENFKEIIKIIIASFLMSGVTWRLYNSLQLYLGNGITIILVSCVGALLFFLIGYIIKIKECRRIISFMLINIRRKC